MIEEKSMKMIENWDKLKISCQRNSNVTKIKHFTPQSDQVTNPFIVDKLNVKNIYVIEFSS